MRHRDRRWSDRAPGAGTVLLAGALPTTALAVALALTAAGATWSPPRIELDVVVARIHGESLTWAAVAERLAAEEAMGRPSPPDLGAWRAAVRGAVAAAVDDVLTRHVMEGQGVRVKDEAIDAAVARVRERYGGEAGLRAAMADMRVSMDQLRETQRRGLYLQALIDRSIAVSDAQIDSYRSRPGGDALSRTEIVARIRGETAAQVIPTILAQLRVDPGVWVIDVSSLG